VSGTAKEERLKSALRDNLKKRKKALRDRNEKETMQQNNLEYKGVEASESE